MNRALALIPLILFAAACRSQPEVSPPVAATPAAQVCAVPDRLTPVGPETPDADEILRKSDIFVIPDFLANAGGVTCSYFEQVQSNMNYYWERDEVLSKLDVKMTSAFQAVHDVATRQTLFMRDAAYVVAINRVAQACRDRGWV